jgi:hypothetical protein
MALWLKADSLSGADGSAVSAWIDSSGNGNGPTSFTNVVLKTGANGLNGLNVARLDGSTSIMLGSFPVSTSDTGFTLAFVARTGATVNADGPVLSSGVGHPSGTGGIQWGFALCTDSLSGQAGWAGPFQNIPRGTVNGGNAVASTSYFASYRYDRTQWTNDGVNTNVYADTSFPQGSPFNYQLGVNNNTVAVSFFNGDIAEIIVYRSMLNSADHATLKSYLKSKWAV